MAMETQAIDIQASRASTAGIADVISAAKNVTDVLRAIVTLQPRFKSLPDIHPPKILPNPATIHRPHRRPPQPHQPRPRRRAPPPPPPPALQEPPRHPPAQDIAEPRHHERNPAVDPDLRQVEPARMLQVLRE